MRELCVLRGPFLLCRQTSRCVCLDVHESMCTYMLLAMCVYIYINIHTAYPDA